MLTKETFTYVMDEIVRNNKQIRELDETNPNAASLVLDYSLQDSLIKVLEESMNLVVDPKYGSTISWWIYDTDCGTKEPFIWFDKGTSKEEKIVLDTVEKLYDFCKKEGEANV